MAKRNVLLCIADDLGLQLGCYGCSAIQTPHIDRLAAEGTKFTKAFASTASCSGSRSTMYTGMHTHQSGQYGLSSGKHHFTTFDHVETLPSLLPKFGYLAGIIGKVHVGPPYVYPWEVREEHESRDVVRNSDQVASFFARAKTDGRPFVLTIGFIDPHRDRTRAGWGNEDSFDKRVEKKVYREEDVEIPEFINDLPGVRKEFASYYQSISRFDQGVGLVLEELDKTGLRDDTLVIVLSDNGPPFLNSKTTLYDAGINLPLIVRRPGSPGGVTNPNMISYVDILPTILDWIGHADENAKPDTPRLGRSILPILAETAELPGWDAVFGSHTFHESTNYWPTRYLRTRRYKYHRNIAWRLDFPFAADLYGSLTWEDIRNSADAVGADGRRMVGGRPLRDYFFRPPEELYDLDDDPREVRNLAADPPHKELLEAMRDRLEAWQRRSNDPWLFRDGVSVLLNAHHLEAGMVMPDNWDLDVERWESIGEGIPAYKHLPFGK